MMILEVIYNESMHEAFEITNYYSEGDGEGEDLYLEADLNGQGAEARDIILEEGKYRNENDEWEKIEITTDSGRVLWSIKKEDL